MKFISFLKKVLDIVLWSWYSQSKTEYLIISFCTWTAGVKYYIYLLPLIYTIFIQQLFIIYILPIRKIEYLWVTMLDSNIKYTERWLPLSFITCLLINTASLITITKQIFILLYASYNNTYDTTVYTIHLMEFVVSQ